MSIAEAPDDVGSNVPKRPLALLPPEVVPDVALHGQRWEVSDDIADELAPGLVFKVEMVLRVEDLQELADGRRWRISILEVGRDTT